MVRAFLAAAVVLGVMFGGCTAEEEAVMPETAPEPISPPPMEMDENPALPQPVRPAQP